MKPDDYAAPEKIQSPLGSEVMGSNHQLSFPISNVLIRNA